MGDSGALRPIVSPNREKRRRIVLLRGMLVVAVGALLVQAELGLRSYGFGALTLVMAFALSDLLLLFVPLRRIGSVRFELSVGALDLGLVALGIHLSGAASGALPVSCLLMILVVALGNYTVRAVAGAAAVGALHAWMVLGRGEDLAAARALGVQIVFLCTIALYYGYLVRDVHRARLRAEAQQLSRHELETLLRILKAVTSSLDLRSVTQTIVQEINAVVPAVRCSLLFLDPSCSRCYVMASHDDPEVDMLEIDLARYPEIRRAIETRDPVIVSDVSTDPMMEEVRAVLANLDFHSLMVVPLNFGNDVLGTLFLKTARADEEFSRTEIDFCTAVAQASANALKNALLHRQMKASSSGHLRAVKKLESVLRHSPDLIVTTDNHGKLTEFNRGAERLLGFDRGGRIGQPFTTLFADDHGEDLVERICRSGSISGYSCALRRRDGGRVEVQLNMSPLCDEGDRVTGTVWIGRDVTELRSTQQQLLQADKLSTVGNVISGVAHELNNPLSVVLGFSQLLMARAGDRPEARQLDRIHEAAQRCQKIVKNLLSFSRGHKPERHYLGANGIIDKTLDLRRYSLHVNDIEVDRDLDPDLPMTMLDFHQIQQVLLNLFQNAQHAMAAVRDRPRRLTVRSRPSAAGIRLEVGDTGSGMTEETLEQIFDPFFTTKGEEKGTGLGLSVSYGIVREHGGTIQADSTPDVGTTFFIDLPVYREVGEEADSTDPGEPEASASARASRKRRILVVDDEPMVLDLLLEILQDLGHHIDTAANGEEAWRKVRERDYDLVLTDVRMPRMSGMELYRNLMSVKPEMEGNVIFTTGDLIDDETASFVAEVKALALAKPIEVQTLLSVVEESLGTAPKV